MKVHTSSREQVTILPLSDDTETRTSGARNSQHPLSIRSTVLEEIGFWIQILVIGLCCTKFEAIGRILVMGNLVGDTLNTSMETSRSRLAPCVGLGIKPRRYAWNTGN